jgi:ribosomal protein S18 acetylase RimI-like enzyme
MRANVRIDEARAVTPSIAAAIGRLVDQLSPSATRPTTGELEEIVASPATRLLLARDTDDVIIGMLTLALYRIPTSMCAWIEDVVVEEACRGRGIGEELTAAAVRLAQDADAHMVDLTSRPIRESANRLYRRMGFEPRETNIYRLRLRGR